MEYAEITDKRFGCTLLDDQAERFGIHGRERLDALVAYGGTLGYGRPFAVGERFYAVSADTLSSGDVFLNHVIVGCLHLAGGQCQFFLALS